MFSSVIFHDQARKRGINPILGCEVYVAPGDRRTKSGTPGETANHLVLLAETNEGYHNLIKLVSSGYTEGFYYKPRIDKDAARAAREGADRPEQLPQGGSRDRHPHGAAAEGDRGGRGLPRHPRAREFLPRDAVPGDRRPARRQHRPAADREGSRARARRHQRRPLPEELRLQAARHPAVHRHRQDGQRRRPPEVPRRSVLPEDRGGDGGGLPGLRRRDAADGPDRGALQRRPVVQGELPPELRRARRASRSTTTSSTKCGRGSRCGCRGCRISPAAAC